MTSHHMMKIPSALRRRKNNPPRKDPILQFRENGSVPWTFGYNEYKWDAIGHAINSEEVLGRFRQRSVNNFGFRIDERIVEYPWAFSQLNDNASRLLDAGSTFNYAQIVNNSFIGKKELTILTYFPEDDAYFKKRISYIYADLQDIPIKDNYYDEIACLSTIEHIGMDNTIYGYSNGNVNMDKNYLYLSVVAELVRVLKNNGIVLITFPFGKFENHGFFQQFDIEMVNRLLDLLTKNGTCEEYYFKYTTDGWCSSDQNACQDCLSYNPHSGVNKLDDMAAHARAVCCIKFQKTV